MKLDMAKRDIPLHYINKTIKLFSEIKKAKPFDLDILEVGCMRATLAHNVDDSTCFGCCDGHSSYLWARTGWNVVSIDINDNHIDVAKRTCKDFDNIRFVTADAIEYVESHVLGDIGILFLDAWDVDLPDCAEKHLEFFRVIETRLNKDCVILIDDTDLYWDSEKKEYFADPECLSGKGRLLIPYLIEKGYEIVFKGRQTLLRKQNSQHV